MYILANKKNLYFFEDRQLQVDFEKVIDSI